MTNREPPTTEDAEFLATIAPSFFGSRASQRPNCERSHDATKMSERITRDAKEEHNAKF